MEKSVKQQEIEEEWDRPIQTLIADWRRDSTWRTIAAALGVSVRTLQRWRNGWGWEMGGESVYDEFSTPVHACDVRAVELGFDDAADLIRNYRMKGKTVSQIGRMLKCSPNTVRRHSPDEVKGMWNLSFAGREKLRECGRRNGGSKPSNSHPWRGNYANV